MKKLLLGTVSLFPQFMYAADVSQPNDFKGVVATVIGVIEGLILLIFVLTVLAIVWGIVRGWIINGTSEEGVAQGKKVVLIGVIALVIMLSIWGILELLQSSIFG